MKNLKLALMSLMVFANASLALADFGRGPGRPGPGGPGSGFGPGGGGPDQELVYCSAPNFGENTCYVRGPIRTAYVQQDYSGRCVIGRTLFWQQNALILRDGCNAAIVVSYERFSPPPPRPPQHDSIYVVGRAKGGTTGGDREAAYGRAVPRAEADAVRQCDSHRGIIVRWTAPVREGCKKESGSKDDYECVISIRAECSRR